MIYDWKLEPLIQDMVVKKGAKVFSFAYPLSFKSQDIILFNTWLLKESKLMEYINIIILRYDIVYHRTDCRIDLTLEYNKLTEDKESKLLKEIVEKLED